MEIISDRINKLIIDLGISKNSFADKIGISSSLISQITTKKNNFRADILQKITIAYPQLNSDWLLNGIGSMWSKSLNINPSLELEKSKSENKIEEIKKKAKEITEYHGLTSRQWNIVDRNREKAKDYFQKIQGDLSGVLYNIDEFTVFPDMADIIIKEHFADLYDVIYNETDYIKGNEFDNNRFKADIETELEKLKTFKEPVSKLVQAILIFYKEFNAIDPKKLIENELNDDYI